MANVPGINISQQESVILEKYRSSYKFKTVVDAILQE